MIKSNLIIFLFVLIYCSCSSNKLTDSEILKQIDLHRPLNEYVSLNDMSDCLGCTHVSGKYYMTDCPFIIEGAKQILALGYKNLKLWFEYPAKGYVFNSNWDEKTITSLKDLAGHPYYRACFDLPFKNISLCINELFPGNSTDNITCKMDTVEQNIYELAKYLLETYKNREITFIFQNWE